MATSILAFLGTITDVFENFTIVSILDIVIVAVLLYILIVFIKQTRSYFIFTTIALLAGIAYISSAFDLGLTRQIITPFLTLFALIFVVVFQREIRRFFEWFSISGRRIALKRSRTISEELLKILTEAVEILAKRRMGALIVLPGDHPIDHFIEGGYSLNGEISVPALLSIFHNKTPGHDGAVIIDENKITRFGVHLPLARNFQKYGHLGTRHRAALGISEEGDALVIVVSEERGTISLAYEGALRRVKDFPEFEELVGDFIKEKAYNAPELQYNTIWRFLVLRNWIAKISALFIAFFLWYALVFQAGVVTREFPVPVDVRLPQNTSLEELSSTEAKIMLSGRDRDFNTFDPKNLKVSVDVTTFELGRHTIGLGAENITFPNYLRFVEILPETITIHIIEIPEEKMEIQNEPSSP